MSNYTSRRCAREQRQASQNQSDELDMKDYMTSNFYRLREEEDIGFLAKTFPQHFDLHSDGRLRKFIKRYNVVIGDRWGGRPAGRRA